jgi:hypothetical protein
MDTVTVTVASIKARISKLQREIIRLKASPLTPIFRLSDEFELLILIVNGLTSAVV